MKLLKLLFCIITFSLLQSCFTTSEPISDEVIFSLNKKQNFTSSKLKWGGMYVDNRPGSGMYKNRCRYAFYKNNLIFCGIGVSTDSTKEAENFLKYGAMQTYIYWWGTFKLKEDTISAIIYWPFNRHNANLYANTSCHYKGILMNGDSIVDWKMIPPYPEYDKQFNADYITVEIKPKTFYFMKFPAKLMVDSNKVWLNKYRK